MADPARSAASASDGPGTAPGPRGGKPGRRFASLAIPILLVGLVATIAWPPRPVLLWNVTASSPRGLYLVVRPISLRTGDMVAAWLPGRARRLAAARHYVPSRVPLLKRVEATAGDRICAWGSSVFVNGTKAAVRRRADRLRRPLHWWTGCRRLEPGELFLLSQSPEAFDGRYFGVTRPSQVVGEARLLWAR